MDEWFNDCVDDVKSEPRDFNAISDARDFNGISEPGDYADILPHNLMGNN